MTCAEALVRRGKSQLKMDSGTADCSGTDDDNRLGSAVESPHTSEKLRNFNHLAP